MGTHTHTQHAHANGEGAQRVYEHARTRVKEGHMEEEITMKVGEEKGGKGGRGKG